MGKMELLPLGDFTLQSGQVLKDAHIAYATYGEPGLPVIVYPTWYSGTISDNEWLLKLEKDSLATTLDPEKYFIVVPALFGNGQSTSPSNYSPTHGPFPAITLHDNIRAQHTLLTTHLKISHAKAILGWSMGAAQTYQWATQYPSFMDTIVPFCGAARCALHNKVFLEGVKSALLAAKSQLSAGSGAGSKSDVDVSIPGGSPSATGSAVRTWTAEEADVGLRALGRVYAGWGFSQAFYREKVYESVLGYKDLEDFLVGFWEGWSTKKDPENMLCMLHTWQVADVSDQEPYNGDFGAAMGAITARAYVLPGKTDLYFPPEDSEIEVANMKPGIGEVIPFPSIWGHWAGGPGDNPEDVKWLDAKLKEFGL